MADQPAAAARPSNRRPNSPPLLMLVVETKSRSVVTNIFGSWTASDAEHLHGDGSKRLCLIVRVHVRSPHAASAPVRFFARPHDDIAVWAAGQARRSGSGRNARGRAHILDDSRALRTARAAGASGHRPRSAQSRVLFQK